MTKSTRINVTKTVRQGVQRLLRSRHGERLKTWMRGSGPAERFGIEVYGGRTAADVIGYFGDGTDQLYQLQQWLPALEKLDVEHSVVLVFRQRAAFEAAKAITSLPMALAVSYPDLTDLYGTNVYRLAIYVNNSMRNFQSMSDPSIVHVHVDHGESDKTSSISNQLKAYDKVFVAGSAAMERCARVLCGLDGSKLVSIGRPPLDGRFSSVLPHDERLTVVYAPTWPGENDSNNFTSVDVLGQQIVEALLSMHVRVIYRPHPRATGMVDSAVSEADRAIRLMLNAANDEGGGHIISTAHNILNIFEDTDVLIADISSVGLDFLYLHTDRGLLLTDRRNDPARLREISPAADALGTVSLATVEQLPRLVDDELHSSSPLEVRTQLRDHYFGSKTDEGSTGKFVDAIGAAIREREALHNSNRR